MFGIPLHFEAMM
jgi:hypothetical protein